MTKVKACSGGAEDVDGMMRKNDNNETRSERKAYDDGRQAQDKTRLIRFASSSSHVRAEAPRGEMFLKSFNTSGVDIGLVSKVFRTIPSQCDRIYRF